MKILDEIRAYNGKLNYRQLNDLIIIINNRVNSQVNHGTGRIPLMYFQKEKAFLGTLPTDTINAYMHKYGCYIKHKNYIIEFGYNSVGVIKNF